MTKKHFRMCLKHAKAAELDPEFSSLPNSVMSQDPYVNAIEPLVCYQGCDEPVYKTFGVKCFHHTAPIFFHEPTRTIKKACWVCRTYFDVPLEQAKCLYIEHTGCGGLLARWLDPNTFRLKGGCTKCDYSEDKEV